MNKRKIATLVAASFAGLMLSSAPFANDATKAQVTAGTSAQTTAPASGAPESRSTERADQRAASSDASSNTEMKNESGSDVSKPGKLGAAESRSTERADEKAADSKSDMAAAKADYKAAIEKCDAQPIAQRSGCVADAEAAQKMAMGKMHGGSPAKRGAPESRITGPQSAK